MFVQQDYILNGQGHGQLAEALQGVRFDPKLMRPYLNERGQRVVDVFKGMVLNHNAKGNEPKYAPQYQPELITNLQARGINSPVFNAVALRKEEWIQLDAVVLRAARYRLRAWADLASANSFGGFNGMGKMILEHETMSDPGEAIVDMDGLTEGRTDAPQFQLQGLPLPLTHSDFWYSSRRLAVSRNSSTPLDTTSGETAGRRVAEAIEKTLIGVIPGMSYGGSGTPYSSGYGYGRVSQVYGYGNFPNRNTATFYRPNGNGRSGSGWVPGDLIKDILAARSQLYADKFYGPFMVYHSPDWDQYLDNDYIVTAGAGNVSGLATQTIRDRLRSIEGITDVRRLDFMFTSAAAQAAGAGNDATTFFPFTMMIVQMTPDVARAVNGMDITTIQWESIGGMKLSFKVMAIQVPQLRADFYGNCGILHATASL